MKNVKGVYLGDVEFGEYLLNVWMNPETKKVFALSNMDVDCHRNFANDPYNDMKIVFEDTFSGLPK